VPILLVDQLREWEFLWLMVVLIQDTSHPLINIRENFQAESLVFPKIAMVTKLSDWHFKPESNILEETRQPVTSAQLKLSLQTWLLSTCNGMVQMESRRLPPKSDSCPRSSWKNLNMLELFLKQTRSTASIHAPLIFRRVDSHLLIRFRVSSTSMVSILERLIIITCPYLLMSLQIFMI
jgi:hypothetical protein